MARRNAASYTLQFPEIPLPLYGRIPAESIPRIPTNALDQWFTLIGQTWASVNTMRNRGELTPVSNAATLRRAWRVWMLSHQTFIPLYSVLADTYVEMIDARDSRDWRALVALARRSAELNTAAGALLNYSLDFAPTAELYGKIRSQMPPGFSGFWIREATAVAESRAKWTETEGIEPELLEALTLEHKGRNVYYKRHGQAMARAVPGGRSLRQEYEEFLHRPHEITEIEFEAMDRWFRIGRVPMTRLDFVRVMCNSVKATANDIVEGSSLDDRTVRDLTRGLRSLLQSLVSWFGPVPESSAHFLSDQLIG